MVYRYDIYTMTALVSGEQFHSEDEMLRRSLFLGVISFPLRDMTVLNVLILKRATLSALIADQNLELPDGLRYEDSSLLYRGFMRSTDDLPQTLIDIDLYGIDYVPSESGIPMSDAGIDVCMTFLIPTRVRATIGLNARQLQDGTTLEYYREAFTRQNGVVLVYDNCDAGIVPVQGHQYCHISEDFRSRLVGYFLVKYD